MLHSLEALFPMHVEKQVTGLGMSMTECCEFFLLIRNAHIIHPIRETSSLSRTQIFHKSKYHGKIKR